MSKIYQVTCTIDGKPYTHTITAKDADDAIDQLGNEVVFDEGSATAECMEDDNKKLIISDIDGDTFHCIFSGTPEDALAEFPSNPDVVEMIHAAISTGEDQVRTYEKDGEEYTTQVAIAE